MADQSFAPLVTIAGRTIGADHPALLVAELSGNHNGDFDRAVRLVRAAKAAGADAIKLQTYTADSLTIDAPTDYFKVKGTLWEGRTLYELYQEASTPWDWHEPLMNMALNLGLIFFSTPFDAAAVEHLERLDVPAYKIASFEIVDFGLLRRVAQTGKPVILSTGMAKLDEIEEAIQVLADSGAREVVLLKCTSGYPAAPDEMHLRTIPHLSAAFGVPVGLSDHTMGISAPVAAVALGARVIEKHMTLARSDGGPDAAFSLEPAEFGDMVAAVRTVEKALGRVHYGPSAAESSSLVFRRSLFVVKSLRAGECLTADAVRSIRPGHGLHPRYLSDVVGRRLTRDVERGTPVTWDLLS